MNTTTAPATPVLAFLALLITLRQDPARLVRIPGGREVDGYVRHLPLAKLSVTELAREKARLSRHRATMPLGADRDRVTARLGAVHAVLRARIYRAFNQR